MPRGVYERTKEFEVTEAPQTHKDVDFNADGVQEVEVVTDMANFNEHAENESFMNEPVRIFIYEGQGNDIPYVELNINGETPLPGQSKLPRGQEYTIKRKFVDYMASMRPVTYTQPHKGTFSELENVYRPHVGVRFPFSIIQDTNPKGVAWYNKLMGK